jgi:hypothetical protein
VTIEFPWDLSSTPHFIPTATLDRTQTITVPITIPWEAATIAVGGSLLAALISALALLVSPPPQPWSLLHSE